MSTGRDTVPCDAGEDPVRGSIGEARRRERCDVVVTVVSTVPSSRPIVILDVVVDDGTGRLTCSFFGRRAIPGVEPGRQLRVAGRLVRYRGRTCLLNPSYELTGGPCPSTSS